MSTTKVQIINKALTKVGAQPIVSIDDNTERARTVNRVYDTALHAVLSECKWNFATKRVNLTVSADTLAWEYTGEAYLYIKPNDLVRIYDVSSDDATYREEGDYIISNTSGLGIQYVYKIDDPTKYTSLFIEALVDRLCADIAYKIVNSASLGEKYELKYMNVSLTKAMAANAQTGTQNRVDDDAWLNAKYGDGQPNA